MGIGGRTRGQEYTLQEGENNLGRDPSNSLQLPIDGISKKHLRLTVNNENLYLEDLGSSNGTFLNGKLIKRVTAEKNDQLALPNAIFQIVYVKEKEVVISKMDKLQDDDNFNELTLVPPMPDNLPGKLIHFFKYKIMTAVNSFNEEYEWKSMLAVILTIFIFFNIAITIFPVLHTAKETLLSEITSRGAHYADEIARVNRKALEQNNFDRLDTEFMDREEGVSSYELFDLDGRIVSPASKMNQYISDPFSIDAREWVLKKDKTGQGTLKKKINDGQIGIAKGIRAVNSRLGVEETVGIVAIRFFPKSLTEEAANSTKSYLKALSASSLVAILFFGIIYYLTLRPLDEMRVQIENVLKGKEKTLKPKYLMSELNPLRNSVNNLLQMIREFQSKGNETIEEQEDDSPYLRTLLELAKGAQGAMMILNNDKVIKFINSQGEDLTGIRESMGINVPLMDVSKNQGFAATVIDLCDQSANAGGGHQKGVYEIGGAEHGINVSSLMGKDGFAKGFYITFVKED